MELIQGIQSRKSIRGYLPTPVSRETIEQVLTLATRSISTNNAQPWEFAVVTGPQLEEIRQIASHCFQTDAPVDYVDVPVSGDYLERGRGIGKQLFAAMGIAREDKERRNWWVNRGYRTFEAPVLIYLFMDQSLDEAAFRFDCGCVAQNICLAALAHGLGTCVANQAITYQSGLHQRLGIDPSKRMVCGIALGYPDPDFPANGVISQRAELGDITHWCGFE